MKTVSDTFTQGGQTQLHKFRMINQVMGSTLKISLLVGLVFFLVCLAYEDGLERIGFLLTFFKAKFRDQLTFLPNGFFDSSWIRHADGSYHEIHDHIIANKHDYILSSVVIQSYLIKRVLQTFLVIIMSSIGVSLFWHRMGKKRKEQQILSGTSLVEPEILTKIIKKQKMDSDLQLADVPMIKNKELQHLLIVGTTGAGKSNAINQILDQIRNKGQKTIVVDITGSFVERFYRPGIDKILNPIDDRSEKWSVWADCSESYHFEALASAFVSSKNQDEYWSDSARSLFVATAKNLVGTKEMTTSSFLKYTISKPLSEVESFFKDTPISSFMNEKAEKTAVGIRSTLAVSIKSMEFLEDCTEEDVFSIREWMKEEDDSWLFLVSTPEMRDVLKPLLTAWISISTKALMSLDPSFDRRIWFIIDELPGLKKIPDLHTMLAEARKYGGCAVLGTQDMSLLDDIYGPNLVRSMANLCSTKIIFRVLGSDADRLSKWLGSQEISESVENISYGAHQMRDGVSLNTQTKDKMVIKPDLLTKLPDLHAYLKLSGDYPLTKLIYTYKDFPAVSERFIKSSSILFSKGPFIILSNSTD